MSRLYSTPSIELPETFSDGRSEIDCVTPYSRSHWTDEPSTGDFLVQVDCVPGAAFLFHNDELEGPDFRTQEQKAQFALRQICHLLIERLDNAGLQEACQSLAEFYDYYRPRESRPTIPSSETRGHLAIPNPGALRRIMPSVEAHPFRILED